MVLSDRVIRRLIEAGRIGIDPYDPALQQPSSLDVRVDRLFRVFRNSRYPYIDVKSEQEDLTELVEVEGSEPFILHPGEFVLGSTLERVTLPDDLVARLEGKALALDTEIPTSEGWRPMAEIRPGDIVFGADGQPTVVVGTTPPLVGRPCKEVVFSDGTSVVCDASHQWETVDRNGRRHGRRRSRIVTTEAIQGSLIVRGERNHQVELAGPVAYPERRLPIEPYVLGAWLGDGTTTAAEITSADAEILDELELAGDAVAPTTTRPVVNRVGGTRHSLEAATGLSMPDDSLSRTLPSMGPSPGKRIPFEYLRASVAQRQALLEGLMDTDGDVDTLGRCGLTTVREGLALDVMELVSSLGFRPTLARKRAMLRGRDRGPTYEIRFTPDRPVFRLPRKRARQRPCGRDHRFRAIADVRDVATVPVRCIEVSAPRGLYLVTRSYIPTHNSSLGRLGLLIHSTAGFIDPGFDGHVTLELSNVANLPITIYPEMKIGQLSFVQMSEPAETPYGSGALGSKYQGQRGPTPSRYWQNFADDR